MGAVEDILREQGRITADLIRRQAELGGRTVTALGQIPLQLQQERLLRAREQRLNQQAASEQQLTDLRLRGEQRAQHEQSALDYVYRQDIWNDDGTFSATKAANVARANNFGHIVPTLMEHGSKWGEQAQRTQLLQTQAAEAAAKLDDARRNALGVGAIGIDPTDDGTFQAFIGHAAKQKWLEPDEANRYLTAPSEARKGILQGFIRQSKEAMERFKGQVVPPGSTVMFPGTDQPSITTPERAAELQAKSVLLDGKPAEVTFNPKTGKYQDASGADVSARVKPMPPAALIMQGQPLPELPEIKPGSADEKLARDLAYGKLTFADFNRLYPSYSRDPRYVARKQAVYLKAGDLNPNFNPAAFEMGFQLAKNPKVQQQLASLDNVIQAVPDLIKVSDEATRSGIPALNALVRKAGYQIGGKSYSNFRAAQIAFADELSGALGYGSATDMSRDMGFQLTDGNLSPDAFKSAMTDVVVPFINRKRTTLLNQMGPYGQPGMNPAATAPSGPPPSSAKIVTLTELAAIAKRRGTTVDQERERYITGGYAVVK